MSEAPDLTTLLGAWTAGDEAAAGAVMDAVYDELRRLARAQLAHERAGHSLTPTALVHEAYLRLIDQRQVRWQGRRHFFAIAARMMRRILVDHARAKHADKRGAGAVTLPLSGIDIGSPPADVDILALDAALEKLAALDPRQSRLVELRFFAGFTVEEAAAALDIAPITVKRDWALARAWLFRELRNAP